MSRARISVVGIVLVAALLSGGCGFIGRGDTYEITAEFRRAVNLYPGSPVRALGIQVGAITDVANQGDTVQVTMAINDGTDIPADAFAVIVPVTVLGERYVQLGPVYEDGPKMEDGDEIPVSRTQVPFEIDELLRGLDDYLGQIDPDNAGDLIENLADLLEGQGQELNDLIHNASGTFDLLADKGDEIGAIVESLAQLTTTLSGRTDAVQELIRSYNTVSGVLATNQDDLNAFITNLDRAAVELGGLLQEHGTTLQQEIGSVTSVGQTLQRNISRLERALTATPRLFDAAARAYDAEHNNLPLNNASDPGVTSDLYQARLRDRLAGLCRRIIVALGGPTAAAAAGLVSSNCANQDSAFWDQLFLPVGSDAPVVGNEPTEPPGVPEPPATPEPPAVPDLPTLLDGLNLLSQLINPDQLTSLQGLSPDMLDAVNQLTDRQLAALAFLTPGQIAALRNVDPDDLAATIDQIIAGQLDPASLLDTPLLPPSQHGGSGDGTGGVGSGLGGILGGSGG